MLILDSYDMVPHKLTRIYPDILVQVGLQESQAHFRMAPDLQILVPSRLETFQVLHHFWLSLIFA